MCSVLIQLWCHYSVHKRLCISCVIKQSSVQSFLHLQGLYLFIFVVKQLKNKYFPIYVIPNFKVIATGIMAEAA
jgi:hypothetical protein